MADTLATTDDILAGHHDGHLNDILKAVFERAAETETEFGWKITLHGDEWTVESVTLAELAFAERHTGVSYLQIDPMRQASHLVALIVAHLHVVGGVKIAEAIKASERLTVSDLSDLVTTYEVGAPKDGPAPSTPS